MVALLTVGSAILLLSCDKKKPVDPAGDEALISRVMDSMEIVTSENGVLKSVFRSPLVEDHEFAKAAFQEHPKGIEVISYDTLGMESSRVVSDYALHWTERDLWELKGNVMVTGENGRRLFTQQLSWDRKIAKIYSNVDSKVEEGEDEFIGEGFEADDDFSRWTFRRLKGRVSVDTEPTTDSTGGAPASAGSPASAPATSSAPAATSASASTATSSPTAAPAAPSASATTPAASTAGQASPQATNPASRAPSSRALPATSPRTNSPRGTSRNGTPAPHRSPASRTSPASGNLPATAPQSSSRLEPVQLNNAAEGQMIQRAEPQKAAQKVAEVSTE